MNLQFNVLKTEVKVEGSSVSTTNNNTSPPSPLLQQNEAEKQPESSSDGWLNTFKNIAQTIKVVTYDLPIATLAIGWEVTKGVGSVGVSVAKDVGNGISTGSKVVGTKLASLGVKKVLDVDHQRIVEESKELITCFLDKQSTDRIEGLIDLSVKVWQTKKTSAFPKLVKLLGNLFREDLANQFTGDTIDVLDKTIKTNLFSMFSDAIHGSYTHYHQLNPTEQSTDQPTLFQRYPLRSLFALLSKKWNDQFPTIDPKLLDEKKLYTDIADQELRTFFSKGHDSLHIPSVGKAQQLWGFLVKQLSSILQQYYQLWESAKDNRKVLRSYKGGARVEMLCDKLVESAFTKLKTSIQGQGDIDKWSDKIVRAFTKVPDQIIPKDQADALVKQVEGLLVNEDPFLFKILRSLIEAQVFNLVVEAAKANVQDKANDDLVETLIYKFVMKIDCGLDSAQNPEAWGNFLLLSLGINGPSELNKNTPYSLQIIPTTTLQEFVHAEIAKTLGGGSIALYKQQKSKETIDQVNKARETINRIVEEVNIERETNIDIAKENNLKTTVQQLIEEVLKCLGLPAFYLQAKLEGIVDVTLISKLGKGFLAKKVGNYISDGDKYLDSQARSFVENLFKGFVTDDSVKEMVKGSLLEGMKDITESVFKALEKAGTYSQGNGVLKKDWGFENGNLEGNREQAKTVMTKATADSIAKPLADLLTRFENLSHADHITLMDKLLKVGVEVVKNLNGTGTTPGGVETYNQIVDKLIGNPVKNIEGILKKDMLVLLPPERREQVFEILRLVLPDVLPGLVEKHLNKDNIGASVRTAIAAGVDGSVINPISSLWNLWQDLIEVIIKTVTLGYGEMVAKGIRAVCDFLFFKVVGTVMYCLIWWWMRQLTIIPANLVWSRMEKQLEPYLADEVNRRRLFGQTVNALHGALGIRV